MDKKIIVGIIVLIVIVALVVTCIFFKKDKDKMVIMKNNIDTISFILNFLCVYHVRFFL